MQDIENHPLFVPMSSLMTTFLKYVTINKRTQNIPLMVCFKNLLANSLNHSLFFMCLYGY